MARYGRALRDPTVARVQPPESSDTQAVAKAVGFGMQYGAFVLIGADSCPV